MIVICKDKDLKSVALTGVVEFNSMAKFEDFTSRVFTKLIGRFTIVLKSLSSRCILDIKKESMSYSDFDIYIVVTEEMLTDLKLADASIRENVSLVSKWKYISNLTTKYDLQISKKVFTSLYRSISNMDYDVAEELITRLGKVFKGREVTKSELKKHVYLTDIVYPGEVLLAYLSDYRYKEDKFKKCIKNIQDEVLPYALRKSIKDLYKEKLEILQAPVGYSRVKNISFDRVFTAYELIVLDKYYKYSAYVIIKELERRLKCIE